MPVLSQDREEDVPECSRLEISMIFGGKIWFLGNGIQEHRPLLERGERDIFLSFSLPQHKYVLYFNFLISLLALPKPLLQALGRSVRQEIGKLKNKQGNKTQTQN